MKKLFLCSLALTALIACNQTTSKEQAGNPDGQEAIAEIISLNFENEDFYTADGQFDEEAAKDAVITLMKYYNYPVTAKTRGQIWVSDYGTGRYAELGLACIGYANSLDDGYMLQDLFLLPGQMLPEHWHEKINKYPAKLKPVIL